MKDKIAPRSEAAHDMRNALDNAEWLITEAHARGHELDYGAAVIAGANIQVAFYASVAAFPEHDPE